MPAPRKRLTTQKSATPSPIPPRAQNHPKSIGNPNRHHATQLVENNASFQKSIGSFLALRAPLCGGRMGHALPMPRIAFHTPHTQNPTSFEINRHTLLLEIAVSYRKQRPEQKLIATRTGVSFTRPRALSSRSLFLRGDEGPVAARPCAALNSCPHATPFAIVSHPNFSVEME
jgi:hypothetical protein